MAETKHKGIVSIGRVTSNSEPAFVQLTIENAANHCRVAEVKISIKQWGELLSGLSGQECEFNVWTVSIGKVWERKEVNVIVPTALGYSPRVEQLAELLKPYEVDGWLGEISDLQNHHRYVNGCAEGTVQRVRFSRFVDAAGGNPAGK